MILAESATIAFAVTAVVALVARFAGALTTGGTIAGAIVGACVSAGFGLPGLAVLGTFFVVGTLATRIGWERKKARGTAEVGEGRRDAKRVLGKGGVAAVVALLHALGVSRPLGDPAQIFAGAMAAALADTLGTEIGTLWPGQPRSVPWFRPVPPGTPGAMSNWGTAATIAGGVIVAVVAWYAGLLRYHEYVWPVAAAGPIASVSESIAVGVRLSAPGFVRNLMTTAIGAMVGGVVTCAR